MRRPVALTSLALAAALTLGACSSGDGEESPTAEGTTTASAEATPPGDELPTVAGAFGETPEITFPGSGAPAELEVEVLEPGDGAEVGTDDYVVANYAGQVWDGEVFDSSFERGAPTGFSLNQVIPGWKEGLTGTNVGDRVLLSIPAELGYGDNPQGEVIEAGDTLVFVVDVVGTYAPDAAGQADATAVVPAPELPVTVEGAPGEVPSVTVDEGAPEPTEPVVTVIANGTGDAVPAEPGSTVVVQFAETLWDNSQSANTWETSGVTGVTLGQGSVFDKLAGVPVGSRAVIQIPGTPASGTAEASPSLAAVVDVVGAHGPTS